MASSLKKQRGVGEPCFYCKRPMMDKSSQNGLAVTRDHYHPRSKGGRRIVLACRTCNSIKKDMLPDDWRDFMRCFPTWWEHPDFRDMGWQKGPVYATKWDAAGNPYLPAPRTATKAETARTFAEWTARARRERQNDARNKPYEESIMILRHGKDYWRAWKERGEPPCDCCRRDKPNAVPIEYADAKQQAAFESIYRGRLHLLRIGG